MKILNGIRWPYPAIAAAATAAAVFGFIQFAQPSAIDKVAQDPPPVLFTDTDVADISHQLAAQRQTAATLFAQWQKQHGSTPDDAAFTTWAETQVPAPPSTADRTQSLHQVQQLAHARTAPGVKAATWLEVHGKNDIWNLYLHDQLELAPQKHNSQDKAELKHALSLAKTITKQLAARYAAPAPYVLDPTLRTDKHIQPGQKCPCSYPSSHGALSAAARTLLTAYNPRRAGEYDRMEDQIAYSRLYMAGHVASDLTAGSLLGDLVGDYILLTSGHPDAPAPAPITATPTPQTG